MLNRFVLKVSILLTGALLTAVHYKIKPSPSDKEIRQESVAIGGMVDWRNQIAPDFELTTIKGERFRLQENVGKKLIVLNFFATWCGPCRAEMPELNRYFEEHKSDSLLLLGIDAEERSDRAEAFLEELKVTFPAGIDQGMVQKKYNVEAFPTTVVIGVDGKVQFYETGAVVNAEVAFDNLLHKNQHEIQAGQVISPDRYRIAAQNQQGLPLVHPELANANKPEHQMNERGNRIAARMECPCGCDDKVQTCSCNTSKKIKNALAEEDFTGKSDDQIIKALNKRYCSGTM